MLCDIANISLERKSHFLDAYQLRSKNNHLGKISRPKHWGAKLRAQQSTPQELEVLKVPIFNLNLLYIYVVDIAVLSWYFFSRNTLVIRAWQHSNARSDWLLFYEKEGDGLYKWFRLTSLQFKVNGTFSVKNVSLCQKSGQCLPCVHLIRDTCG